jgi:hypothetical protein
MEPSLFARFAAHPIRRIKCVRALSALIHRSAGKIRNAKAVLFMF